ncbi:MAG: hypothetical protein H7Y30_14490, partial [Pyrinomonadaceae bacterium]|nr:hypothetical protein [Pyrinomonadaceae bacterium]
MSQTPREPNEEGEVVYRRLPADEQDAVEGGQAKSAAAARAQAERKYAPTLKPLAVGFALLLGIVFGFGIVSVRELEKVESGTSILLLQHTEKVRLFLSLHAAASRLDNEARARGAAESRREFMPPVEGRLRDARGELEKLLPRLDRPPFTQHENWRTLRRQLVDLIETTRDPENYSLNGYARFRDIDRQLEAIDADLDREQAEVNQQSEALESQSSKRVRRWWVVALLVAALVIFATVWEVQRRYRHEQQSMDEARRERRFSTQMLEGMVSAVAALDARARIRSANTAFFEIFPQATIGISVYDKFAAPEAARMLEAVISEQVKKATYRGRWLLEAAETSGGVHRTFDVYSSPLEIDGEQGQIVTLVDVSEAVEAEAVLRRTEALAAVGQASAQVAHEIKNPLGSIRLGVSMLRDMTDDEESLSTIDLVERGIDHLNKLVADVTNFSRQQLLSRTEFNLHQLLDSSVDLVSDRVRDKQTEIKRDFSREPLRGEWDEDQLRQVFVNLLANAIDASAAG